MSTIFNKHFIIKSQGFWIINVRLSPLKREQVQLQAFNLVFGVAKSMYEVSLHVYLGRSGLPTWYNFLSS